MKYGGAIIASVKISKLSCGNLSLICHWRSGFPSIVEGVAIVWNALFFAPSIDWKRFVSWMPKWVELSDSSECDCGTVFV